MLQRKRRPGTPPRVRDVLHGAACALALLGSAVPVRAAEGVVAASQPAAELRAVSIPVEGMVCISCAATIKRTVKAIEGVTGVEVMLTKNSVEITYAPSRVSPERVAAAINALGYKAGTPVATAQ